MTKQFDSYGIYPSVSLGNGDEARYEQVCPEDPIQADIWSLYGHIPGEGLLCISDCTTYEGANDIYRLITGEDYGLQPADFSPEMLLSYSRNNQRKPTLEYIAGYTPATTEGRAGQ